LVNARLQILSALAWVGPRATAAVGLINGVEISIVQFYFYILTN
jgi:hypothetical protein